MIRLTALAALLFAPSVAQAQKDCVNAEPLAATMLAISPDLLKTAAAHCRPMLSETAFLTTRSAALGERIGKETGDAAPLILALVKDLTGVDAGELDPKTMVALFGGAVAEDIAKMDKKQCVALDLLLAGLEPLPASNLKQVIAGFMILGNKAKTDMNLCTQR